MTLQVALSAPIPIRPYAGAVYHLDGRSYALMNGTTHCIAFLINHGTGPATVAGCFSGSSRSLTIEAGDTFMIGWHVAGTTWRALRMCGARTVRPDGIPPDVQPGPVPADAAFLVEDLNGAAAPVPLFAIAAYLAGTLPALVELQPSTAWGALS